MIMEATVTPHASRPSIRSINGALRLNRLQQTPTRSLCCCVMQYLTCSPAEPPGKLPKNGSEPRGSTHQGGPTRLRLDGPGTGGDAPLSLCARRRKVPDIWDEAGGRARPLGYMRKSVGDVRPVDFLCPQATPIEEPRAWPATSFDRPCGVPSMSGGRTRYGPKLRRSR